jgi:hypothetical protein
MCARVCRDAHCRGNLRGSLQHSRSASVRTPTISERGLHGHRTGLNARLRLTQPGSLQTFLMQTGAGGATQGGIATGGQATQSVAALELVLLEKNTAAADDSATGWQFSQAFATVIVTHCESALQPCEYLSTIWARAAAYAILPASQLSGGGLFGTQMGQHWPACISACVSTGQEIHTCLHWQVAQHAPAGTTGSLPSAQTMLGQSMLSQTSDSPPAPAAGAGAPAAPAPGAPAPGAPAPGAPAPGAPAITTVPPACPVIAPPELAPAAPSDPPAPELPSESDSARPAHAPASQAPNASIASGMGRMRLRDRELRVTATDILRRSYTGPTRQS